MTNDPREEHQITTFKLLYVDIDHPDHFGLNRVPTPSRVGRRCCFAVRVYKLSRKIMVGDEKKT